MKVAIKNDERGLLFKDGNYVKCLKPGKYSFICEKIGNVSLTGGGSLLEQLNTLLSNKVVEKQCKV